MKKPEKKEFIEDGRTLSDYAKTVVINSEIRSHNNIIDQYEAYINQLANVEVLEDLLEDKFYCERPHSTGRCLASVKEVAQAISKYIKGGLNEKTC